MRSNASLSLAILTNEFLCTKKLNVSVTGDMPASRMFTGGSGAWTLEKEICLPEFGFPGLPVVRKSDFSLAAEVRRKTNDGGKNEHKFDQYYELRFSGSEIRDAGTRTRPFRIRLENHGEG